MIANILDESKKHETMALSRFGGLERTSSNNDNNNNNNDDDKDDHNDNDDTNNDTNDNDNEGMLIVTEPVAELYKPVITQPLQKCCRSVESCVVRCWVWAGPGWFGHPH